jgi:hypothetical protein
MTKPLAAVTAKIIKSILKVAPPTGTPSAPASLLQKQQIIKKKKKKKKKTKFKIHKLQ